MRPNTAQLKQFKLWLEQIESRTARGFGSTDYYIRSWTASVEQYRSTFEGIDEMARPTNKLVTQDTGYIEIARNGIKAKLDAADLHIVMDYKGKYTTESAKKIQENLADVLRIIEASAKLDEQLKPKSATGIEI